MIGVPPTMRSCLYECQIMHHRFAPRVNRFVYRIFMLAIDLDEVATLDRSLRLFSFNRANLYSFRDRDYLPMDEPLHQGTRAEGGERGAGRSGAASAPTGGSLKARVLAYLRDQGQDLSGGRVMLVTLPRVAGYLFNPVSFYFCYDRAGAPAAAVVEVTNTFREMKPYFLGAGDRSADGFHRRTPKHFYVSPFSDVDVAFDFALHDLGEPLAVQIDDYAGEARTLTSTLAGRRRRLTDARLAWYAVKYPLITLRVIALIHWHAFLLWGKRVPWFAKGARAGDQRDLYRPYGLKTPAPATSLPP